MELFYDETGQEIREFDVLRVFHFIGAHRKKEYMYKWVKIIEGHFCAMHLMCDTPSSYYALRSVTLPNTPIKGTRVVQTKYWDDVRRLKRI